MTQLDRLEALAEKPRQCQNLNSNLGPCNNCEGCRTFNHLILANLAALPDLIRVARAAKKYRVGNPGGVWNESEECREFYSIIDESPLFSEVES